jgi:hypothetical protein
MFNSPELVLASHRGDDHYEIEFSDNQGRAYAMAALRLKDLVVLHYTPVSAQPVRSTASRTFHPISWSGYLRDFL